ncbi:ProQ/FINO family protein [Pseudomonas aeruginosa]|uniref:ProQ/FINO family protein n=1 Tax=Pseudomonas aeruginosa TaxID=287 RepID=UPI0015C552CF|nr:ProQ/FINO family protein [Pseudomonas aeruginosa]NPW34987.1 ProQ activator of osmoprotectant transporter prop [Pseudomonas aeruginosa]
MGFEQLAELRDRLRAQAEQAKPAKSAQSEAKASSGRTAKKREPVEPEVEAIWRLQRHFPLAFPKNPAPKVPLKQGILEDAQQHLESLGITAEQLKQAIATWCQGNRYWSCMVADAPRLDLQGQVAGKVTAEQALYAKRQASRRQRDQMREKRARRAQGAAAESVADKPEVGEQPDSTPS